MRRLLLALPLIGLLFIPQTAQADSITAVGQIITVTAQVDSKILVVVNGAGKIIQIFSNSHQTVPPTFLLGSVDGPAISASSAQRSQYNDLMRDKAVRYGFMYQSSSAIAPELTKLINRQAATIPSWNNR